MKKTDIIFILIILIKGSLSGQEIPVEVKFQELAPLWEHNVLDETFDADSASNSKSEYNSIQPSKVFREGDKLFCLHRAIMPGTQATAGYVVEVLDVNNGTVYWQDFKTFYNSEPGQEAYINLIFRDQNLLELVGFRNTVDTFEYTFSQSFWEAFGGRSFISRIILDKNTGERLEQVIGRDTCPIYMFPLPNLIINIKNQDQYLLALQRLISADQSAFGMEFYLLDSMGNYDSINPLASIPYDLTDTLGPFSMEAHQGLLNYQDSLVIVRYHIDRRDFSEPYRHRWEWFDVSDLNNIRRIRVKDWEDVIPRSLERLVLEKFSLIGNHLFLNHYYQDTADLNYYSYLLWSDMEGKLVSFIPKINFEGHHYISAYPFYTTDSSAYFLGFPSSTGRMGYDILKLDAGEDQVSFLSSITAQEDDVEYYVETRVYEMYPDGKFIFGATSRQGGDNSTNTSKIFCFDAKDMGMDFLVSSGIVEAKKVELETYPNPMNEYCKFQIQGNAIQEIAIYSSDGRLFSEYSNLDQESYELNITGPSGLYYYRVLSNDNQWYSGSLMKW